jgi:hypothetical protein
MREREGRKIKLEKPPPLLRPPKFFTEFLLAHFRFFLSLGRWLLIITSFDAIRQELLYISTLAAGWKYLKD